MGVTPCTDHTTVAFDCQFDVQLKDSSITTILAAFCKMLPQMLADFIEKVVIGLGEYAMSQKKPFCCDECGNDEEFLWNRDYGVRSTLLTKKSCCPTFNLIKIN